MAEFDSNKGDIPEIDNEFLKKMNLIASVVTTFESNDLHMRTAINFRHDEIRKYVFMDALSIHNGMKIVDAVFGFDEEKIKSVCQNILDYFEEKNKQQSDII